MSSSLTFQEVVMALDRFWAQRGCLIWQPYNHQVGAGTMNPATALRVLGPEPWNVAYVEPSIRPDDGRYGENPNRLQQHFQYQVILKPDPGNPQELYLESLQALGLNLAAHDVRFVEDNWESPALGAWGLGWEVWLDGQEITQFTYFQQAGGLVLDPVAVEITYGLERILIALQRVRGFREIRWNAALSYADVNLQSEQEYSKYYFEVADVERMRAQFDSYESEAKAVLAAGLVLPAYDNVLRCSHAFNVLDTRGAVGVTERAQFFKRMRNLTRQVAEAWRAQRAELGHPLLVDGSEPAARPAAQLPLAKAPATFLLEIGTEELPAADVDSAIAQLQLLLPQLLLAERLAHGAIVVNGTPRRLAVSIAGLPALQPDAETVARGPAVSNAFDAAGQPTPAAQGFARGKGVAVGALQRRSMDGGEYVVALVRATGQPLAVVLAELAPRILAALEFKKSMRWRPGRTAPAFSRPVRWLAAMIDAQALPFEWGGLQAGSTSRALRSDAAPGGEVIEIGAADSYSQSMRAHGIILEHEARARTIMEQAQQLAAKVDGTIAADAGLLAEVANLVECPTAFLGSFEEAYLELPQEVLVSVMKKHQRYFPVWRAGRLLPFFVGVRNGDATNLAQVVEGNEHVIRARFADASYFVRDDLRHDLAGFRSRLARLTFHEQLGSMLDKSARVETIVERLAPLLQLVSELPVALRAAHLCKADLASRMVVEMTALQGVMGRAYALRAGEPPAVAQAIEQHYWPQAAGDPLPESAAAAAVALADRLDTLCGLFALGLVPTGSADPFGLRRAALGVVQILLGRTQALDLRSALTVCAACQPLAVGAAAQQDALAFIAGRLRGVLLEAGHRHDVVEAVLAAKAHDPYAAQQAAAQLSAWLVRAEWAPLLEAFARCARMTRELDGTTPVLPAALQHAAEQDLWRGLQAAEAACAQHSSVDGLLRALQPLAPLVVKFFEDVLVMDEDAAVRSNRLGLLQRVAALGTGIADLSKLEGF
ncbi:MAG: glycine--tRNA ligase subunit beta [Chloroflexi bacterium]|nr:MAG: glycine--tRNA ligase subunit beta [Chloroflexota bacterium]RLT54647.1 MAG: glycine--tRNA ligase subunit beta [Chloroflexota bacterium]